jgi:hypothetical protein
VLCRGLKLDDVLQVRLQVDGFGAGVWISDFLISF